LTADLCSALRGQRFFRLLDVRAHSLGFGQIAHLLVELVFGERKYRK
jgi:hypothetical protein